MGSDDPVAAERVSISAVVRSEPPEQEHNGPLRCSELERENARLRNELLLCQTPENSALGHFLRTVDAQTMSESQVRIVETALRSCPVKLQTGEAQWIVENADGDGPKGKFMRVETLVRFLRAPRVASELTLDQLEELRKDLGDEKYFELLGPFVDNLPR